MSSAPTLVWFRQDLRLADQPALAEAAARGAVVPVYILPDPSSPEAPGAASRWWLHHALADLAARLKKLGAPLILRRGKPLAVLLELAAATGAQHITWNRCYEPASIARDTELKKQLQTHGLTVTSHNSALLFEPWTIATKTGSPYRVFTPFEKACRAAPPPERPLPAPTRLQGGPLCASDALESWNLLPTSPDWATGLRAFWKPTEARGLALLGDFVDTAMERYPVARDFPAADETSHLSPYLHWGQIGPRQVWAVARFALEQKPEASAAAEAFLRELIWREFGFHLLFHFPHMPTEPLQPAFAAFPWRQDPAALAQWQKGQTGYPIVDAGMRQLWQTGWMHNRVRMIVGSFLVKHLLLPWQDGAAWFWETLVDADLACNAAGWQWIGGCGADAAPYYRIFNPILQGQRFDPEGTYIKRYVPELARVDKSLIHAPWQADPALLSAQGVVLGTTYPAPMVDHAFARQRALDAVASLKTKR